MQHDDYFSSHHNRKYAKAIMTSAYSNFAILSCLNFFSAIQINIAFNQLINLPAKLITGFKIGRFFHCFIQLFTCLLDFLFQRTLFCPYHLVFQNFLRLCARYNNYVKPCCLRMFQLMFFLCLIKKSDNTSDCLMI